MLGFASFWIGLIYLLTFLSGVLCIVYGILNWNKGDEPLNDEVKNWALQEKKIEQDLD